MKEVKVYVVEEFNDFEWCFLPRRYFFKFKDALAFAKTIDEKISHINQETELVRIHTIFVK